MTEEPPVLPDPPDMPDSEDSGKPPLSEASEHIDAGIDVPVQPSLIDPGISGSPARKRPKIGLGLLFQQLKFILSLIYENLRDLMGMVINIKHTTDVEGTIATVKSGIEIQGYNIWILIASTVLACIGLDTNSVAVIIGAMLISPLMSPIIGIGLSIGINDRQTLQNALYNFGIAVGVSLLVAFIYFLVTPLGRETAEMAARTKPTVLDIMVGFFGGVAGIVAGSRMEKTNAIPGVAIATALMPPLCVAGYGLANMNMSYFAGAFYLFFLNSVFITLSTFLIVRYLNFPLKEKITASLRKNFLRGVSFFVIISMVPAVWLFIDVIRTSNWDSRIQSFLIDKFPEENFSVEEYKYIVKDTVRVLKLTVAGTEYIPKDTVLKWEGELLTKYGLKGSTLNLIQTKSDPNDREQIMEQMQRQWRADLGQLEQDRQLALERQREIERLKGEISFLKEGEIPMQDLRKDLVAYHEELVSVRFGEVRSAKFGDTTTRRNPSSDKHLLVLMFLWQDSLKAGVKEDRERLIRTNLKENYNRSNVQFIDLNEPVIIGQDSARSIGEPQ